MRRVQLLAIGWMILATTGAVGQNLVVNGDFDEDVDGWVALVPSDFGLAGTVTIVHSPSEDALELPGSGAMLITWDITDPNGQVGESVIAVGPCNDALNPSTQYDYGISHRDESTPRDEVNFAYEVPDDIADCDNLGNRQPIAGGILNPSEVFVFVSDETTSRPDSDIVRPRLNDVYVPDGQGGTKTEGSVLIDKLFLVESSQVLPLVAIATVESILGLEVSLLGSGTGGVSPFPLKFFWDFGDGSNSEDQTPVHTYSQPGTYALTLTVDSGFEQASHQIQITLGDPASEIPTVSSIGLAILAAILGLGGMILLRSRGLFPTT